MALLGQGQTDGASWRLHGPALFAPDGAWSADLARRLYNLTQNTAQRLKRGAQAAYSRYPALAAGFQQVTSIRPPTYVAGLQNVNPIFPFREYDTKPHVIAAKNGGRLAFMYGGHLVRPRAVNHPGTHGLYAIPPLFAAEEAAFAAALATLTTEALTRD